MTSKLVQPPWLPVSDADPTEYTDSGSMFRELALTCGNWGRRKLWRECGIDRQDNQNIIYNLIIWVVNW